MSRATPDDQLKFLLNCVKHSNNGKIDFIEVAKECAIVSKGAAAKRYERLMKANGIHPNGGPSTFQLTASPSPNPAAQAASKSWSKKRKLDDVSTAPSTKEKEERGFPVKVESEVEKHDIKTESLHTSPARPSLRSSPLPVHTPEDPEGVLDFNDYCQPSVFGQPNDQTEVGTECLHGALLAALVDEAGVTDTGLKHEESILIPDE